MVNNQAPPQSIVPRSLNKKIKLLDIDPIELARQLTIMESQLFLKIRPMECILRSREQRIGREDHIATIIHMTNQVSILHVQYLVTTNVAYRCLTGLPT